MGKHKYIETPDKLWDLFQGYVKETRSNPILVHDFVGKDGNSVYRQRQRPLTMEGFSLYVCENSKISYPNIKAYFNGTYEDYLPISSRIKDFIRQDQIEGGMAMIYSQSITARLNGLVEKQDINVKTEQPLFDDDE